MANKKYVWTFTNQRKLTKGEFIDYFEKKVFKTIRKYEMLPEDKIFRFDNFDNLNSEILEKIIGKKFSVEKSTTPNMDEDNLSGAAEKIFNKILSGDFTGPAPKNKKISYPLYFHSDAEIETYANQIGLKGKKMQRNKKIQSLFNKFKNKNPDLEINVVKALAQIR
jgi:hypothetical protein